MEQGVRRDSGGEVKREKESVERREGGEEKRGKVGMGRD